jgi:hypothetical protein
MARQVIVLRGIRPAHLSMSGQICRVGRSEGTEQRLR